MGTVELTLLTPAQAARALHLSESSVRRLCDQGALASVRTEGGHRRIRPSAVAAYVRQVDASAGLSAEQVRAGAGRGGRRAGESELVARATSALVTGDATLLRRLLSDLSLAGQSAAFIADRVLGPALAALGQQWCDGSLSVYREHRASELVLSCLAEARRAYPSHARARRAVCAAPEGDPNSIASAVAAWVLAELGYAATTLGANMPFDGLDDALRELRPRLIVLSVSHVADRRACSARCRLLYANASKLGCALAIGGRALTPALRAELSADFFGDTMTHLRDYAQKRGARGK
jgi:MerR family transcriptional regulator, light-induced transcriptional regulator